MANLSREFSWGSRSERLSFSLSLSLSLSLSWQERVTLQTGGQLLFQSRYRLATGDESLYLSLLSIRASCADQRNESPAPTAFALVCERGTSFTSYSRCITLPSYTHTHAHIHTQQAVMCNRVARYTQSSLRASDSIRSRWGKRGNPKQLKLT